LTLQPVGLKYNSNMGIRLQGGRFSFSVALGLLGGVYHINKKFMLNYI
jgi:hypothetical protein